MRTRHAHRIREALKDAEAINELMRVREPFLAAMSLDLLLRFSTKLEARTLKRSVKGFQFGPSTGEGNEP